MLKPWGKALRQGHATFPEEAAEGDQGKPYERRGVVGFDALKERDPQTLGLEAASAVVGFLRLQIAFDLCRSESLRNDHPGDVGVCSWPGAIAGIQEAEARVELHVFARGGLELGYRGGVVAGFAQDLPIPFRRLVGADDEAAPGVGLATASALARDRRFTRSPRVRGSCGFRPRRGPRGEGQPEPLQQQAAMR